MSNFFIEDNIMIPRGISYDKLYNNLLKHIYDQKADIVDKNPDEKNKYHVKGGNTFFTNDLGNYITHVRKLKTMNLELLASVIIYFEKYHSDDNVDLSEDTIKEYLEYEYKQSKNFRNLFTSFLRYANFYQNLIDNYLSHD